MTALVGRKVRLKTGTGVSAVGIVGAQNDSINLANGEIDITDKDDNGYRTLHSEWGTRSLDITVEGVVKSGQLLDIATSATGSVLLSDYTLEVQDIGTFTGDFWMSSLALGAPSAEGVTFTATFLSSGEYTYEPAT